MKCSASLLLTSLILCAAISCKKGDTGPAGSANVIYSEWFTPDKYIKDTVFSTWGFKYNKAAPEITQDILDNGVVLTYGKLLGYSTLIWPTNEISQLPITVTYLSSGVQQEDIWTAYASAGNLRIRFTNDHNYWTSIATTHQFRYVIIPGGKKNTVGLAGKPYKDISRMYNLPD